MLIKCPKCRSVYDLPDKMMPPEGLKMRCSECGEIWMGSSKDALKAPSRTSKDIRQMFESVSKNTADLFKQESNIKVVKVTHVKHNINIFLLLLTLLTLMCIFYIMRYDIVRIMPGMERVYNQFYINPIYYGRDLEFEDISSRELTESDVPQLEISGRIVNKGDYVISIPPVQIKVLDAQGKVLAEKIYQTPISRLEPHYDLLLNTVIPNPGSQKKSIYLTFHDYQTGEK